MQNHTLQPPREVTGAGGLRSLTATPKNKHPQLGTEIQRTTEILALLPPAAKRTCVSIRSVAGLEDVLQATADSSF